MKSVTSVFLAVIFSLSLCFSTTAEETNQGISDKIRTFVELLPIDRERAIFYWMDEIEGADDSPKIIFSEEEITLIKSNDNVIANFDIDYAYGYNIVSDEDLKRTRLRFTFYTSDYKEYSYSHYIYSRDVLTVDEIIKNCGMPDSEKIVFGSCGYIYCTEMSCSFKKYNIGWNEIDNKQYYIKSDGTMITKSCKIGGIRYKFTSDGVCKGKYTGWTKSSKGRRYWKDGILITNRYLRTKSGVRYFADENGYVSVCD